MKFSLSNTGEREINDKPHPKIFPFEGYNYRITIKPKSTYWRIGLRFSTDPRGISGFSQSHRYNDTQIKNLEISVGARDPDWKLPNRIQLEEHYITPTDSVYFRSDAYTEGQEVTLTLSPKYAGLTDVELISGTVYHRETVDLVFSRNFQVFGWADSLDFNLTCEVIAELIPVSIQLDPYKALTDHNVKLDIRKLAVFFGTNNSGKTSVLMGIINSNFDHLGHSKDYLGLNRVHTESEYNFELETAPEQSRGSKQRDNRRKRIDNKSLQYAPFDWIEELALQDEDTRKKIIEWVNQHFDRWNFVELKRGKYLTGIQAMVSGMEPKFQGSGARAIMPIIIQLYNPEVTLLAIDEPELALEPKIQKILLTAIKDATEGRNGFPLKRVLIATHSHLFLDRTKVTNNFHVHKQEGQVIVNPVHDIQELQDFTYTMLGASPSDLFFPGNIVVVEGKTDYIFLKALYRIGLEHRIFSNQVSFHFLEGYDKLAYAPDAIIQMLKTQVYSTVYKDKICGLIDKAKKQKVLDSIRKTFNDTQNERFVMLDKQAIEFYYPLNCIEKIFGKKLTEEQYHGEVETYLKSISKKKPHQGKIFEKELTKAEFAYLVEGEIMKETLGQITPQIFNLLKKADELAFQ